MEDSAVYTAVAENDVGAARCSGNLIVDKQKVQIKYAKMPPSFTRTIHNACAASGQLIRFDAHINGTKPVNVLWLKDGHKIASDIRYKTLEEDEVYTLLIIEVIPEDSGKYECIATNSAGEARCEANCIVQASTISLAPTDSTTFNTEKSPSVVEQLKNQTVQEGQAVEFKCKITANPTPQIKWQKGTNVIKLSKYFQMIKEEDFYTLRISEAFPEDEGVYICTATNSAGTVTLQANLRVLALDNEDVPMTSTPIQSTFTEDSEAEFKTMVSGKPKPAIQWLRDSLLISKSPGFQIIQECSDTILVTANTIEEDSETPNAQEATSAEQVEHSTKVTAETYEYVSDSEMGPLTGSSASEEDNLDKILNDIEVESDIDVEYGPEIVRKLSKVTITRDGDGTRFEVKAVGKPKPTGKWLKQGKEIITSTDFIIEDFYDGTSTLTISEVYPDDAGEIVFEAHNPLGVATTSTELIVESIPGSDQYTQHVLVSNMKELQKQSESKPNFGENCSSGDRYSISVDSLECLRATSNPSFTQPNFPATSPLLERQSVTSVCSEPISNQRTKLGFVQSAMTDYLNSHRHSLSSVMELIDADKRQHTATNNLSIDIPPSREYNLGNPCDTMYVADEPERNYVKYNNSGSYFVLSPIEENSEPSTESSSYLGLDKRKFEILSSSCEPIPSQTLEVSTIYEKYQTFPRSRGSTRPRFESYYEEPSLFYPLEPREIDPAAFFQLHTADSQEELQEFLLLESECMSDAKGRGLATAFDFSADDISTLDTNTSSRTANH